MFNIESREDFRGGFGYSCLEANTLWMGWDGEAKLVVVASEVGARCRFGDECREKDLDRYIDGSTTPTTRKYTISFLTYV